MSATIAETRNYRDTLSNGLTVVTIEMPHLHTVEISMLVRAGLRMETETNNGISHFLEHMLFRGNERFPDSILLSKEFEKIGKDLRGSTSSEYTHFGFCPHSSKIDRGLELFREFFSTPNFNSLDLERQIILEEYLEDLNADGVNVDINNLACRLLYSDSPLAWPIIGTDATIKQLNEEMLQRYFADYYHPANMILVGAGNLDYGQFVASAEKHFSTFNRTGCNVSKNFFLGSVTENQQKPCLLVQKDTDNQVQMQICFRSVSYNHPDYLKELLVSDIFDGGVSSRLQRSLREEHALVYTVECRATSLSDIGTFDFDVGVSPEKVIPVARILFDEIKKFVREGPTDEEVQHVKMRHFFDLDFELDDPYKQIQRYGFSELYSEEMSVEEERSRIEKITRDELHAFARDTFIARNLNVILVGPVESEMEKELTTMIEEF